jgi:hypothetical protein
MSATHRLLTIFVLIMTLLAPPAIAADFPPFKASYVADMDIAIKIRGTATRTLVALDDDRVRLTSEALGAGMSLVETAVFRQDGDRVVPLEYKFERKVPFSNKLIHFRYDYKTMQIVSLDPQEPWQMPFKEGTLDKVSYQAQLQLDHAKGKTRFVYPVVTRKNRLKHYEFRITGQEEIETASGTFLCDIFQKIDDDDSRDTKLWVSDRHEGMIIQLAQLEKGQSYVIMLDKGTIRDKAIKGDR